MNDENIKAILYRPFDIRYTYYTGKSRGFHCMPRNEVMRHMLKENLGMVIGRQGLAVGDNQLWNLVTISQSIIDFNLFYRGGGLIIPLYLYPDEHKEDIFASSERELNISKELLERFAKQWQAFQPEQLFYYVYAILYSNQYRERFAQYLRMDFPRIPFTEDYELFSNLADLGKELAEIHLLRSPRLSPLSGRYQGSGSNDMVEYIKYDEDACTVHINPDKYFEGITPELWNYHIGGYQVLYKYLKDRKGKVLAEPIHYCRILTALSLTTNIQAKIDNVICPLLSN
jgi:predicted helicase